jgi:cell division protein FtsZ
MGIGVGSGEDRAVEAAKHAISSPLLETTIEGARRILINIKGGQDLTLQEVHEAAQTISEAAGTNPEDVYFGAVVSESVGDELRVTVIATGFEREQPSTPPIVARTAREAAAYELGGGRQAQRPGSHVASGAQPPRTPIRPGESPIAPVSVQEGSNVRATGPGASASGVGAVPPPRVVPIDPRPMPPTPPQREDELEVPTFLRKRKQ